MVLTFVIVYLLISVCIGLLAATRVHNTKDFAIAGRSLPLPIVMATVFATWFGAEAVMGISATFAKEGLRGVVADPFGSSLCLVLAGLFFAPRFYRLNLLTVGDYYRLRYDRRVEVLCTLCIVASYLGWVAAQFKVLGLVFNVVTEGAVSQSIGMVIGALIVLTYTTFGGMFSVAILDFVQLSVIVGGLLVYCKRRRAMLTGGVGVGDPPCGAGRQARVFSACLSGCLDSLCGRRGDHDAGVDPTARRVSAHHQREGRTNGRSWVAHGGGAVLCLLLRADVHRLFRAACRSRKVWDRCWNVTPSWSCRRLIVEHTPMFAQVMFFGAVLSAVMSCSSATLLAPSVILSENVIRGAMPRMDEKGLLTTMRVVLVWLCRGRADDCTEFRIPASTNWW